MWGFCPVFRKGRRGVRTLAWEDLIGAELGRESEETDRQCEDGQAV